MTEDIAPIAPQSLPKYLAEGVPKQDIGTLEDLREYVDELIEHKQRDVDIEEEVPDDAEVVEASDDSKKGSIYIRSNTCGDETCHCITDGELHGPYEYLVYRDENGDVVHEYLGLA